MTSAEVSTIQADDVYKSVKELRGEALKSFVKDHMIKPEILTREQELDQLGADATSSGKFRLQNKTIHLTYPCHVNEEALKTFIEEKAKQKLAKWSIVNETGSTGHEHSHALLRFNNMLTTQNVRFFDFNGAHPNIKKVTTQVHYARTVKYHLKQGKPFTNIAPDETVDSDKKEAPSPEQIWKYENVQEMLTELYDKVPGARAGVFIHGLRPKATRAEPDVEWRPWQKQLLDELDEKPDDRTIKWYWDPNGNSGKSYLTKYAAEFKGAFVTTRANAYHLATMVQEFLEEGQKPIMTVFFNFTRQCEEHKVYQAIEQLKDGMITSEKYKGKTMIFPSPHVVVMANYLPMMEMCSLDRWNIRRLDGERVTWVVTEAWIKDGIEKYIATNPGINKVQALHALKLYLEGYVTPPALPSGPA